MKKIKIILVVGFGIIIIFIITSFIWVNFDYMNKMPIKEKMLNYLDNTSYIKVKRETSLFKCNNNLEININDTVILASLKEYVKDSLDSFTKDFAIVPISNKYTYVLYFYNSDNKLLFKVNHGIVDVGFETYSMVSSKDMYKLLVEDLIKDMDSCYPIYKDYVNNLQEEN